MAKMPLQEGMISPVPESGHLIIFHTLNPATGRFIILTGCDFAHSLLA
jgi:hypothetical protein